MNTGLTDDTFVTVLLCAGIGAQRDVAPPLTTTEWNDLGRRLVRANWRPGDVLRWGGAAATSALELDAALGERIDTLLAQTVPVAAEIDRMATAGIRVLSRADDGYAATLRSRLKAQCPPLLFYAGPLELLGSGGIAVVGSRNVDEAGASFARAVGAATARSGATTISGAARGVDREGMFGALEAGGVAVGVMPDGLSRALRSPDVRLHVANDSLLMISPFRPDARFEVWRAMGRNKVIYALAEASVVVSCDEGRGGTWTGALENLKHDWSPLFVRCGESAPSGNIRLAALGALPLSQEEIEAVDDDLLAELLRRAELAETPPTTQQALANVPAPTSPRGVRTQAPVSGDESLLAPDMSASDGQLSLL